MSKLDPEFTDIRDKIIETHTDMKHVRWKLEYTMEISKEQDARIRELEQNQGKIMTYVVMLGSIVTLAFNGILFIIGKLFDFK